jgi:hypothetical protein
MSRESFGHWLRRSPQAQQFATLCQEEKKNVPGSIYDLYEEYATMTGQADEDENPELDLPDRAEIMAEYDFLVEQVAQARAKGIMRAQWEQERSTLGEARHRRKIARRTAHQEA